MKKTDLYKNLGLKIDGKLKQVSTPDRFAAGGVLDRKEQRKLDQEKGLIPQPLANAGQPSHTVAAEVAARPHFAAEFGSAATAARKAATAPVIDSS